MRTVHIMHVPGFSTNRDNVVKAWSNQDGVDLKVHADRNRNGVLWNHLNIVEAMLERADESEWHLQVQDDTIPIAGWQEHLVEVGKHAPRPIVGLTHTANWGSRLVKKNSPFGIGSHTMWGVAMLFHRDILQSYYEVVRDVFEADGARFWKHDDQLPAVWAQVHGTETCMTARALFTYLRGKSTVGNKLVAYRPEATIETHPDGPAWDLEPYTWDGVMKRHGMDDSWKMLDLVQRYRKQTGKDAS